MLKYQTREQLSIKPREQLSIQDSFFTYERKKSELRRSLAMSRRENSPERAINKHLVDCSSKNCCTCRTHLNTCQNRCYALLMADAKSGHMRDRNTKQKRQMLRHLVAGLYACSSSQNKLHLNLLQLQKKIKRK